MNLILIAKQLLGFVDSIVVPFIFAIAFLVFIWGIFQYFIAGGADEEKRTDGRNLAISGIIGFFIMVAIWGIVNLLVGTFGFDKQSRPDLPTFGSGASSGNGAFQGASCSASIPCPNPQQACVSGTCQ